MPAVRHLVLFRYLDSVDAATRQSVIDRFLQLRDECRRDGRAYVRSIEGGPQTSSEAAGAGWDDGFVVSFDDAADRDWYVGADGQGDPAHAAFSAFVAPHLAAVAVLDFEVPVEPDDGDGDPA